MDHISLMHFTKLTPLDSFRQAFNSSNINKIMLTLEKIDQFNRRLLKSKKFWALVILTKPIKYFIVAVLLVKLLG